MSCVILKVPLRAVLFSSMLILCSCEKLFFDSSYKHSTVIKGIGEPLFYLDDDATNMVYSDMTWVGDRLIGFEAQKGVSQDYNSEPDKFLYINEYANGAQNKRTAFFTLRHRFGHCNTVDYNPDYDCLIIGNGSGSYNLDGDIIIIPDFKDLVSVSKSNDNPIALEDAGALVIHCADYDLGTKFNLVWETKDDGTSCETAFLITASKGANGRFGGDLETIRKIRFCKGIEQGNYGKIVPNNTPFNGTFFIEHTFYQKTKGYNDCIQGGCYADSELFACVGHGKFRYWKMELTGDYVTRYEYYDPPEDGPFVNYGSSTGICVNEGLVFIGKVGVGVLAFHI